MSETVYINFSKNTLTDHRKITIGNTAQVWCRDSHIASRVKSIVLANAPDVKSRRYVFSVINVISLIEKECDNAEVNNVGVPEFVVSYKRDVHAAKAVQYIKIAIVSLIVFFGGAFAIMAYGNDIDINSVMSAICNFATGGEDMLYILQISYCVGLTAGIIIFYNHIGRRRYEKDPTPLEVQATSYFAASDRISSFFSRNLAITLLRSACGRITLVIV